MLPDLIDYTVRILPGLLVIGGCYLLARRDRDPLLRIVVLVLGFVLIRDAMTPLSFWRLGGDIVPWLRFPDRPALLLVLGLFALGMAAGLLAADRDLRALVRWGRPTPAALALGVGGGVLVAAPGLVLAAAAGPLSERGGAVATGFLPVLLLFAMAGNLIEEVLFRGMLQGRLEQNYSPAHAAVLSAGLFAACHAFLASTVTDIGWPLLAFTLYEGLICAFLRMRHGVIPATLAHGLGIFLLAAGLL